MIQSDDRANAPSPLSVSISRIFPLMWRQKIDSWWEQPRSDHLSNFDTSAWYRTLFSQGRSWKRYADLIQVWTPLVAAAELPSSRIPVS
jgi:hypothetical protein